MYIDSTKCLTIKGSKGDRGDNKDNKYNKDDKNDKNSVRKSRRDRDKISEHVMVSDSAYVRAIKSDRSRKPITQTTPALAWTDKANDDNINIESVNNNDSFKNGNGNSNSNNGVDVNVMNCRVLTIRREQAPSYVESAVAYFRNAINNIRNANIDQTLPARTDDYAEANVRILMSNTFKGKSSKRRTIRADVKVDSTVASFTTACIPR